MATTEETIRLTIEAKGAAEAVQILNSIGVSGEAATKQVADGMVKLQAASEAGQARIQMLNAEFKQTGGQANSFTQALKYLNAEQTLQVQTLYKQTQATQQQTNAQNQANSATNAGSSALANHSNAVSKTSGSYTNLTAILKTAIAYLSFKELVTVVDQYNTLQSKLALVSGEAVNVGNSISRIIDVSAAAASGGSGAFHNILDVAQAAGGAVSGTLKNIQELQGGMDKLPESAANVSKSFTEIKSSSDSFKEIKIPSFSEAAKGATAYAVSLDGTRSATDAVISQQDKLALEAAKAAEAAKRQDTAYQSLKATAILTGQNISTVVDSYVRLSNATEKSGYSQAQLLKTTDLINKSLFTNRVSGQAAETALTQLGQAFSAGRLRGQDWNSVIQQAPGLIKVLAQAITGGSIPALKEMALNNQLTTDVMVRGILTQENAINDLVAKTKPTIAGAFQSLQTAFTDYIGTADKASGVSAQLAQGILTIGQNLNVVIPIVAAFAAVWATVKVVGILTEAVGVLGPFAAGLLLIVAATALVLDKMGLLEPTIAKLKVAYDEWLTGVKTGLTALGGAWDDFVKITQHDWDDVKQFFTNLYNAFEDAKTKAVNTWNAISSAFVSMWDGFKSAADAAIDYVSSKVSSFLRAVQDAANMVKNLGTLNLGNTGGGSPFNPVNDNTQQFRNGGSMTIPGAGPTDSRLVQFMATPGEVVQVMTPAQAYGQALPHFRDGGTLGLGGGGYGVDLGLSGVSVQYVASANQSVTGYNGSDPIGGPGTITVTNSPIVGINDPLGGSGGGTPSGGPVGAPAGGGGGGGPSNGNSPDLAAQIANALSIGSTTPLTYQRSVSSLGYMRKQPEDTQFIDGTVEAALKKGIDVAMFYGGITASDIRKGPLYYQGTGKTQQDYDKLAVEYQTALNDFNPFAQYPGGKAAADAAAFALLSAGAIPWNQYKLALEGTLNNQFHRFGSNNLLHARDGMDYTVPGGGAVDSRLLHLAVSPGERVSVETPAQQAEGNGKGASQTIVVHQTIMANNVDDVRRSQAQIEQETSVRMARAARRSMGQR